MPYKNVLREIGLRIKKYRESQNLSQEDLSLLSELHRTTIGNVELGKHNVSLFGILKICRILNISISDLLENIEIKEEDINPEALMMNKINKIKKKRKISNLNQSNLDNNPAG